jgi:tRNA-dihydrouridine synthase
MISFWSKLKKPIFVQAPMDDVTDTVFRQIIAKCGKPDVFFTEFTNAEGMCSRGKDKVGKRLIFSKVERPIVAQIWGITPAKFYETAKLIKTMGFDGIDINMGCPQKNVVKKGACGALIDNPNLAKEIILAVREGAGGLPISIKTRIGVKEIQTEKWISFLLKQNLDCLIIHGRTIKEMSDVPCHWDEIGKAVKIRDSMKLKTLIIGNGDIKDRKDALEKIEKYKVDGVMIGRGIFNNLWIFNKDYEGWRKINPDRLVRRSLGEGGTPNETEFKEKLKLLIEHITLFDKTWGKEKNFSTMKKFYRIYVSNHPNAKEIRMRLMQFKTASETLKFLGSKASQPPGLFYI